MVIDGLPLVFKYGGTRSYLESFLIAYYQLKNQAKKTQNKIIVPNFNIKDTPFDLTFIKNHPEFNFELVNIDPMLKLLRFFGVKNDNLHRYLVFFWEKFIFPKTIRKFKPTLIFHPYQIATSYPTPAKKIVVVHDVFHWKYQERYSCIEKYLYNRFKIGCQKANKIITISQTSKQEIMQYLNLPENKIIVCYEGVGQMFESFKIRENYSRQIIKQYNLPTYYILGINSQREYKNTLGTVRIFHQLTKKPSFRDLKLVLIGPALNHHSPTGKYVFEHSLNNKIITYNDFIIKEDLCYFYALSQAFIFLSYEEGFGLPPLESIACGSLPIVSNLSALGEIFNQQIPSFNPKDINAITQYLNHILTQPHLKKELIVKAQRKLLPQYSWHKILPLYLEVLNN